jgi:hypothetical protein
VIPRVFHIDFVTWGRSQAAIDAVQGHVIVDGDRAIVEEPVMICSGTGCCPQYLGCGESPNHYGWLIRITLYSFPVF